MSIEQTDIERIIGQVAQRLGTQTASAGSGEACAGEAAGCFDTVEEAVAAARKAFTSFTNINLQRRGLIIAAMRRAALDAAENLAVMAQRETGFGKVEHKILKNRLAAEKTPGIEDLGAETFTGDDGLTLVENAPYGVIGAITPSTNPPSTIINNSISMVASGNAVVYNPHPMAKGVSLEAIRVLNRAIVDAGGPENLLCSVKIPTMETSRALMEHRDIRILVVTGGEAVVKIAMRSGKKVIAAGPGNPPVIVDNTALIAKAAGDIVRGASFDNNILCVAEKEVFVFNDVAEQLISEMTIKNCYRADAGEILKLESAILEKCARSGNYIPNKRFVGKDAGYIIRETGIGSGGDFRLIIAEVDFSHPFVHCEMLMPVLPVVRVNNLEDAVDKAIAAENGCRHTAIMHSQNVSNLTYAARKLDTTIFVKNAPSFAGLGIEGEGFTTLTIATPTGEGLTSARTFTRRRRCVLSGSFRIL